MKDKASSDEIHVASLAETRRVPASEAPEATRSPAKPRSAAVPAFHAPSAMKAVQKKWAVKLRFQLSNPARQQVGGRPYSFIAKE